MGKRRKWYTGSLHVRGPVYVDGCNGPQPAGVFFESRAETYAGLKRAAARALGRQAPIYFTHSAGIITRVMGWSPVACSVNGLWY